MENITTASECTCSYKLKIKNTALTFVKKIQFYISACRTVIYIMFYFLVLFKSHLYGIILHTDLCRNNCLKSVSVLGFKPKVGVA